MHIFFYLNNNINGDYMEIKHFMSRKLIVASYNDSIKKVSNMMMENDIGFIPISKKNKIIGVITDRDIVVRCIAIGIDHNSNIESYISPNVINCDENDNSDEVLKVMSQYKIKRIIVTSKNKIVGILSISDIIGEKEVLKTLKDIYKINKNDDKYETEIDEFYL